ncbi:KUP/HAK/KT family potassium transporter [Laribacter hongkongensis]|uniref:potassium transporter Kup n=1 Tax=Laribacter hongkongensis TaxID=168471 RepID=UPI001EFD0C6F|nr:KUP/HAK/KT family potassium transporter [Laribacter hongkongensis]MCG9065064.1 KUP/HAK/KT family potassium transporter [Laribacter hongkongensis]MCG9115020.1 KUP/HAK/KT family potassium transporter [Laribacter hongkongensis]
MNEESKPQRPWALALAAMGVVYGDIGTSPLYAFKAAFSGHNGFVPDQLHVLAALSMLFWSVLIIISLKYMLLVLRFDNNGEGGALALAARVQQLAGRHRHLAALGLGLGILGATLFFGDAMITPAISVLSAIEGLSVAAPAMSPFILPLTLLILVGLFSIQRFGTGRVGRLFGPVMLVWFAVLALLGVWSIAQTPVVLLALSPTFALAFALDSPGSAFVLLSAVFLAMTGGEALYADMGHFGRRPIRLAWFSMVWPALMLNYFGQGAFVLRTPAAVNHPFFELAPAMLQLPLVILAALATVIASQATIAGVFSMTTQASRLGYLPPFVLKYTSATERGQIYLPGINWLLMVAVMALVLGFRSSGSLASAYGIAVSGAMNLTTLMSMLLVLLLFQGARRTWLLLALLALWSYELLFLGSNLGKFFSGGWLPLLVAALLYALMTSWKRGMDSIANQRRTAALPLQRFVADPPDVIRVPGTAIYLSGHYDTLPAVLQQNLKHYHCLHQTLVILHVESQPIPFVAADEHIRIEQLAGRFWRVRLRYGFREEPDVPASLMQDKDMRILLEAGDASFFLGRVAEMEKLAGVPIWRRALFHWLARQGQGQAVFYRLPADRVVIVGTQAAV